MGPGARRRRWESQFQRYEERIIELHSVIAEHSRKMEETRDDMIKEESEVESNLDNQNIVTDSFVEWTRSFATGTSSRTTPDSPSSETSSSTPTSVAPS